MIAKFFIERPVLANVIAVLTIILGAGGAHQAAGGAVSQHRAADGAGHRALSRRQCRHRRRDVALPIEQKVNGVEGMIYMSSMSTSDGSYTLTVTFRIGTDADKAQILVQNRVDSAQPALPQAVQTQGVQTASARPRSSRSSP